MINADPVPLRIGVLTTSLPRFPEDEAGIFVGRLVEALSLHATGVAVVPADAKDQPETGDPAIVIKRYRYGIFTRGRLAFGSGIIPNIKSSPLLLFQAPALLLGMLLTAWRARRQVDIYHCNWVITALIGWMLKLLTGKPYVVSLRGRDAKLLTAPVIGPFFQMTVRSATAVTSVNESFLDELIPLLKIDPDKMVSIPNGVSVAETTRQDALAVYRKYDLPVDAPCLLFIGTMIPRKRTDQLISLLADQALNEFHLILCGRTTDNSYMETLRNAIDGHDLKSRVHITGPVPPHDVPELLKLAFAYVTASALEGRPNSVLEAFVAGVPVIASDIPAHAELITDGENGFLFDPEDPDRAVSALVKMQTSKDLRDAITTTALRGSFNRSWEECARDYIGLFKRVLGKTQ